MNNSEIDTYQICECITINPKLNVTISKNHLITIINGDKMIGNLTVIKKCVDISKLKIRKTLIDNKIVQEKTAMEILSEVFGVSKNSDYETIYNKDDVWKTSQILATKKGVKTKNNNNFKLKQL